LIFVFLNFKTVWIGFFKSGFDYSEEAVTGRLKILRRRGFGQCFWKGKKRGGAGITIVIHLLAVLRKNC